jgi:hypothetical protein
LSKEFNNIVSSLNTYNPDSNEYKLLNIFLNDENIWSANVLFNELENFDQKKYEKSSKFINEFKESFYHINKLCNVYMQLLKIFNVNKSIKVFDLNSDDLQEDGTLNKPYDWHRIALDEYLSYEGLNLISNDTAKYVSVYLLAGQIYELTSSNETFDPCIIIYDRYNNKTIELYVDEDTAYESKYDVGTLKSQFIPETTGIYTLCFTSYGNLKLSKNNIVKFTNVQISPAPQYSKAGANYPIFTNSLINAYNEIIDCNNTLKLLFKNSYENYDVSAEDLKPSFMSSIRECVRELFLEFGSAVLENRVNGINFYLNKENQQIVEHDHINELTAPFYNLINNRISNLELMKLKLDENIELLNEEIQKLHLRINKFSQLSGYDEQNEIKSDKLLCSANFFINEIFKRQPMSKFNVSEKIKKLSYIDYQISGLLSSQILDVDSNIFSDISLINDHDSLIKNTKINDNDFKLYYFPPDFDIDKTIEIQFKIENLSSFVLPSSTYTAIKIPIIGKSIDVNNIKYDKKVNMVPSSINNEPIYYFNEINFSLTSGSNIVDHYEFYNEYLIEKINYLSYLIDEYNANNSNSINDTTTSVDKIYLPSITELGFGDNNEINEGIELNAITYNSFDIRKQNLNCSYLTRSPNTIHKFELYEITEFGSINYTSTNYNKNGLVVCLNLHVC